MKSLFYALCILLLHCATSHKAYSQTQVNLGLNISTGLEGFTPSGKRGVGGTVEGIHMMWKHGGIRASIGYEQFDYRRPKSLSGNLWLDSVRKYPGRFINLAFVPVRLGVHQFVWKDRAFLYGEAGMVRYISSRIIDRNSFSFSTGAGYRVPTKRSGSIQLSVAYNYNSPYKWQGYKLPQKKNYISFIVAYGLTFRSRKGS